MIFSSVAMADSSDLSENEQQFLGSWVMYMAKDSTTYLYAITFFDDQRVVLKTVMFEGSTVSSDHVSSGKWCGFTSDMVILTLAGNDFAGGIKEDGSFVLLDYETKEPTAFFTRCPDLSDRMI
jgi:hypothetical protein